MAFFGRNKQQTDTTQNATPTPVATARVEDVLIKPRITEKAAYASERGVYVFLVADYATKADVKRAIRRVYNVEPRKVNIAKVPSKRRTRRGHAGRKAGGTKAYVYLKEGDKIELM